MDGLVVISSTYFCFLEERLKAALGTSGVEMFLGHICQVN